MSKNIVIIDYGLGNLCSVQNAFKHFSEEAKISSDHEEILNADYLVLPGVGSFSLGVAELEKRELREPILKYIATGKPFLGICLGMQLMLDSSEESPGAKGLGIFPGEVKLIPSSDERKVPHIGWSEITEKNSSSLINFSSFPQKDTYFVHSYAAHPKDESLVQTTCDYKGVEICASLGKGKIFGCQFHPEKSAKFGLSMISQFLNLGN